MHPAALSVACYNQTDRISSFYKLNMCTRNIKYCDRCGTTKLIATLCNKFGQNSHCFEVIASETGPPATTRSGRLQHMQTEANGHCCTNSDKVAYD